MARSLAEALEAVRAASTRTDSLIADRAGLKKQVEDLLAGQGKIPQEVQDGLDAIFDIETADAAKIDEALNANVPAPVVT
jgi:hypothetical protein